MGFFNIKLQQFTPHTFNTGVSNNLDPDQDNLSFVGPDLSLNCLQRLSVVKRVKVAMCIKHSLNRGSYMSAHVKGVEEKR